jgi:hypothetical protein
MYEDSGTIVVCRPNQVKEAAVVLSCSLPHKLTPLIVLDRPPISEHQYRDLYEDYCDARNRRDEFSGASIARTEPIRDSAFDTLTAEVDLKAERLTPYRSWAKHNQLISNWLSKFPPKRAIFLFDTTCEDLRFIEPTPRGHIRDERLPIIPEEAEWIFLLSEAPLADSGTQLRSFYSDLNGLAELSWGLLRNSQFPASAIEIPSNDLDSYFVGLDLSLKASVPLRPVVDGAKQPQPAIGFVRGTTEAVVIEISNDANRLMGVLYANLLRAKTVFCAEPDLAPVEAARAAIENMQEESAKAFRYVSAFREKGLQLDCLSESEKTALKLVSPSAPSADTQFEPKRFLEALARLFGKEDKRSYLQQLEQAVSAAVPQTVADEVGNLDVTVFTSGLPYNFVRKPGADWSRKNIGHVSGDSSLVILEDLLPTETNTGVGFNLVFDPGFFTTSETRDVLTELQRRVSYPIVLSGLAGTNLALTHLSVTLPVELVFFNTHGSDNAILLRDMPIPAYKLVQRLTLRSRPIVFNNSCLSWVGVGREFIRSGARAYLGTLWSVDASYAARFAQTAIRRMTQENTPVGAAIRGTGVDAFTESAYILIGTARARLASEEEASSGRERLIGAARYLFHSASTWLEQAGGNFYEPYIGPLAEILVNEADRITGELDKRHPEAGLDRLDLLIQQLGLLAQLPLSDNASQKRTLDVFKRAGVMANISGLDDKTKAQRQAELLHFWSRVCVKAGQYSMAAESLRSSIEAAKKAADSTGPQYLELSDALKILGKNEEALAAAKQAKEEFGKPGGKTLKEGPMLVLGRLAQISIRMSQYDSALEYAREGFKEAESHDNVREQSNFKGDETRALMRLNRGNEALEAAKIHLSLARQAHDDRLELSAYGTMAEVLILRKDWEGAIEKISVGLAQARAQGVIDEVGIFLMDLASVKSGKGDGLGALECMRQAGPVFGQSGQIEKLKTLLSIASDLSRTIRTWPAYKEIVKLYTSVIDYLDERLRLEVCVGAVFTLKEAIAHTGVAESRKPLQSLHKEITEEIDRRGASASQQAIFVSRVLGMFDLLASGRTADARKEAGALDQMSAGRFEFLTFIGKAS